jgi:Protein of unknown function (DUF4240)
LLYKRKIFFTMTTLRLQLHEIGPTLIRDLRQRFPNAAVDINIHDQPIPVGAMDDARFWKIIALLEWKKSGNDDAVLEPAVQALAKLPEADIYRFADILSEKLWLLDTEAHAKPSMDKHPKSYLSVDDFLYIRCCVVANGKKTYEHILRNPGEMPDLTFSKLLHLPSRAYQHKTGQEMQYIPAYNYETYSNEGGWL